MPQFRFLELTDKWQIAKVPLWEGYPLEWQLVPPREYYMRDYHIECFRTGAEAISCFAASKLDIEQDY